MRTLSGMRTRVRRYINDIRDEEFDDSAIDSYLKEASDSFFNMLVDDNSGKRCLLKTSAETNIAADQEDYEVPSDCLRIHLVQFSDKLPNSKFRDLIFSPDNFHDASYSSGLSFAAQYPAGIPLYWLDDADETNKIRIAPQPAISSGAIRFKYYFKPVFPAADDDSFNLIDEVEVPYPVPDGCDTAIEYLATALLSNEELDNSNPIGAYGQLFRSKFAELKSSVCAGVAKPVRRYIRIVI